MADAHQQAIDRLRLCVQAEQPQRTREQDDLRFQVPEKQWPEDVKQARGAQTVAGIPVPARPMISIPMLDQPIQLVLNQEKAAHLGIQIHALSEDSDDDTAEVLEGLYRRIEVDSRANLARSWAYERAVKAGRGAYRVLTELDPTSPAGSKDQRIVIKRILHQEAVYFDPYAQEPDWSDGEWAFVTQWIPISKYRRLYKGTTVAAADEGELNALANDAPEWCKGDGEGRAVLVAEYFAVEGDGDDRKVIWRKMNGQEFIPDDTGQKDRIWFGKYIPLIPVIGRELIPIEGERWWVGIIGPNKGTQQLFNYSASAAVEMAALESKASHAIDPRSIENYEDWWKQKNTRNLPYLPYRRFVNSQDLGPPVPLQADMSKVQVNLALLGQAREFIHSGTAVFEPSLGAQSSNVRTKGATLALQNQAEQANSHWLDNLAEITLPYEAKVVLDLMPAIYDRPGRVQRILDLQGDSRTVVLNQPFTEGQNGARPQPISAPPLGQPPAGATKVFHYDLRKGRYGVTVDVGKAYKRRADEGRTEIGEVMQAAPQLIPIVGDVYFKYSDFPGAREISERMKKMLPPQLQDQSKGIDPAVENQQLKAQLAQAQQALTEMQPHVIKAKADVATEQLKQQANVSIAQMNNAAKLAVAHITASKDADQSAREAQEEQMALGVQLAHEADQNAQDRAHETALAAMDHQHTMDQTDQGAQIAAAQSAQDAAQQPQPDQTGA